MSLLLRRLLNYLPYPHGRGDGMYLRPSWHKPTPFDHWRSSVPFRPRPRADQFGRGLRRRRRLRGIFRWTIAFAAAWIVLESLRALAIF